MEALTSKPATYGLSKNQPTAFQCNSHSWSKLPSNCPQTIDAITWWSSQYIIWHPSKAKNGQIVWGVSLSTYIWMEGPAVGVIVCILLCLTNTPSDIIGKIVFPFQRNAFSSGDRLFWWTSINLVIGWPVKVPSHRTLERRKEELWEFLQAPDERMCMYKYCQSWYLIVYNWNRNACPNKQLYFEPGCVDWLYQEQHHTKSVSIPQKKGFKIFFAVD